MSEGSISLPNPFRDLLGIQALESQPGESHFLLELEQAYANPDCYLHGGVIATLLDIAMAYASWSVEGVRSVATVSMQIDFLEAVSIPGTLHAQGWTTRRGQRLHFVSGDVWDAAGRLVGQARGTFAIRRADGEPQNHFGAR
ncbi:MAG: PaaI family thioesterase [Thermaerobacter sp.]|nr:PaaI family thioesterase [Thermaerobacter sp.]